MTNECCERFSYHGMRGMFINAKKKFHKLKNNILKITNNIYLILIQVILALYFRNKLGYNDDISTIIYHVFTMLVAFFPLLGALMADAWIGKFKTILYLSIVYAIGQILLSAAATPIFGLPIRYYKLLKRRIRRRIIVKLEIL